MIIDCHAHVFQNWHGACGHPSIDVHLKYIQKNVTRPAAETFRVRDGMRVKPGLLFRDGDNTWAGLKDVDFRIGRYGRLEFMHEGEEYAIQYMPVGMQTIESPPEFMIAQMLYAGVDHCILQAGGGYGAMNDYNAFTQHAFPEKFTGLLHIDEAVADREDVLAEADRAHALGLKGLYYSHDFSRHGYARNLDRRCVPSVLGQDRQVEFPGLCRAFGDARLRQEELHREPDGARPADAALSGNALRAGDGAAGRAFCGDREAGISRLTCLRPTSAKIS